MIEDHQNHANAKAFDKQWHESTDNSNRAKQQRCGIRTKPKPKESNQSQNRTE